MVLSMPPEVGNSLARLCRSESMRRSTSMPASLNILSSSAKVSTASTRLPSASFFFARQGPMNTTLALGRRRFISMAWAIMGDTTGERQRHSSG